MIGGYVIADFKNVSLVESAKSIEGIYQSFVDAANTGKPVYAKNFVAYDEEYLTFIPKVKSGDGAKVFSFIDSIANYFYTVTVNSNDTVMCVRKEI